MNTYSSATLFAASVVISALVTRFAIAHALRRNLLDHPNERSSHTQPVPRVGGIGIALGLVLPYVVLARDAHWWTMAAGIGAMAGVGLLDDFRNLAASRKYMLQLAIVALLMWSGVLAQQFSVPGAGAVALGWVAWPLTLIWLTGFSNFFNFIDGTNGMAGGSAVILGGFFAAYALAEGRPEATMMGLLMAGSALGFLFYNFPRAKTFMGDMGSLSLGLCAALLALSRHDPAGKHVTASLILCSVIIYDCTTTIFKRLQRGENIFAAHKSHHYQRLARTGWGHTRVAWLYYGMQCAAGALGFGYLMGRRKVQIAILAADLAMLLALSVLVRMAERPKALEHGAVQETEEMAKAAVAD